MFVFYPKLDANPVNAVCLEAIDEAAVERFTAAYSIYAKSLGSNMARAVAISHTLGSSEAIEIYTLHIRLAGVEQTLFAVPILNEDSLEDIDGWLINEFDIELEYEDSLESGCQLLVDHRPLRIEEEIAALVGLDVDIRTTTELMVHSSRVVDRALAAYEKLDADPFDGDMAIKAKLTTYAFLTEEPCEECGEEMVFVAEVVEIEQMETEETRRSISRHHFHRDEYHAYCVILSWLCHQGEASEFVSLNHVCTTEEEMTKAVAALHKNELATIDSMMADVANIVEDLAAQMAQGQAAEDEQGDKPTLH